MKKINLKNLLLVGLIASTSTLAIADNLNDRSFAAGIVTGAVLNNIFTSDKYLDKPVYIYDNKYYYGGNYQNGYYYHNGIKLHGGKYYDQPRFYNNSRYKVFMTDRYYNEPVYVYNGRYFYGGKYKHRKYYFNGYKLRGGEYYFYPRIHHKHRFSNSEPRMYENNDNINDHEQNTRSYNDDRDHREYDQNDARYRNN